MSAVQTLDISPVGRVEGDLDVRVDIEDGVVTNAWTNAEMFRGFEVILKDKDPQAGLVVTPRACGICGASHLTCAAWALDTAWGTTVPRNAILARNLGQIVESLQSLPRHHYGLFMIDFTNQNYARSQYFEEAVKRYSPFTGTSYEAGVTISGRPVEIYASWSTSAAIGLSHFGLVVQWSATKKFSPMTTFWPGWTKSLSMRILTSVSIGEWPKTSAWTSMVAVTRNL